MDWLRAAESIRNTMGHNHMNEQPNVYERGNIPDEERKRLEQFEYPLHVSTQVLGEDLSQKRVLDIGAGPNTKLGEFVQNHGGHYAALDISQPFLAAQQGKGFDAVQGTAVELPIGTETADIVHMRFVLMHLSPEARARAITEAFRAGKERVIFVDFSRRDMQGSQAIKCYFDFQIAMMHRLGIEPFMGEKLGNEVKQVLTGEANARISERVFQEGKGNFYHELLPLIAMERKIYARLNNTVLSAEFD